MNQLRQITGSTSSYDVTTEVSRKRGRYKKYTIEEKRTILAEAEEIGFQTVSQKYVIADSTLYTWRKWMATNGDISSEKLGKYRKHGSGCGLSYSVETDQKITSWVMKQREQQLPVSQQSLQSYSKSLVADENPDFKASKGWLQKFMKRNNLSTRRKTTMAQKMPADLLWRIDVFRNYLKEVREQKEFDQEMIVNMDEVPMYFDFVPRQTIHRKGDRDVPIITTGGEKRHFTAVLAVAASGAKLPPMIIFEGKRPLNLTVPDGWIVTVNPTAWMTEDLMKIWLTDILKPYTQRRPTLLVMDSFAAHTTEAVDALCEKINCTKAVIPGGCTSKVQPLDVCLNKPFKDSLRRSWSAHINEKATVTGSSPSSTTKEDLLGWIEEGLRGLSSELVSKSFTVTGIVSNEEEHQDNPEIFESDTESEFKGFLPEDLGLDYGEDPFLSE